jgi:hypothetical protein
MAKQTLADARSHNETGMAVARAKKAAKGDGINLAALKVVENRAKLDSDERELIDRKVAEYALWLDQPIGSQTDMFGSATVSEEATAEQHEWTATGDGLEAGKAGKQRDDNPYPAGSAVHVAWDKAWLRGQKIIAKQMGPTKGRRGKGAAANGELAVA